MIEHRRVALDARDARGFTLVEVLLAIAILAVSLLALLGLLGQASLSVYTGGAQSKATSYARQQVEVLRNLPLTDACYTAGCSASDSPETGVTRTWSVAQVGATGTPNRIWRITATVSVAQSGPTAGPQSITIETMRAE